MGYVRCISHEWWCDRDGCYEDISVIEHSVTTARRRADKEGWIVLRSGRARCPKHAGDTDNIPKRRERP